MEKTAAIAEKLMEWSETVKIPEPVRELFNQLKKVLEKDIAKTEERSR